MNKISMLISLILYWIGFSALLPDFLHQVDPDGIAYINEAKVFFSGDFNSAINGCWSPLFPVLLSPFVKLGIDPLLLCRLFNGVFSCLILFSFNRLIKKLNVNYSFLLALLPFAIALITLSMTFYLLGPDVLQTLLLSVFLNLLLCKDFFEKKAMIMLASFIGALCYFAKAYNFSLIILLVFILFFLHYYFINRKFFSRIALKKLLFFYLFFLIFCSPYIIAISIKYQHFTFSTAGPITMHKSLAPEDFAKLDAFIPPASKVGLASSDDPSLTVPHTINLFTSKHYFFKSIKTFFATIIEYTKLLNEISFASIAILFFFIFYFFRDRPANTQKIRLLTFTLLYPIGYFLIAIEWRYVWINIFTILLMLSVLLNHFYNQNIFKKWILHTLTFFLLLSFCAVPAINIRKNDWGENAYQIAVDLKKNGIQGNFVYDPHHSFEFYYLSYFSNSKCFGIYNWNYSVGDIVNNKDKYAIKYIFCYYKDDVQKNKILSSGFNTISKKVYDKEVRNLIVFELK